MSEIKVGENETLESALRRFKRRNQKLLERESSSRIISFERGYGYANN